MKWRRPTLDEAVRQRLELRPKERVLAWADDGAGRAVVASDTALHLQRQPPDYTRIGWEQIERASYEAGVLSVTLVDELGGATMRVPVGGGRELPVVVRDRVTANVLVDRFVALDGDHGVRIVGRRAEAGVQWRSVLDPALAGRADMEAAALGALSELQGEVGDG